MKEQRKKYINNKKSIIVVFVIVLLIITLYFGTALTGDAISLGRLKKTSIERSASDCTMWRECNVQLKIRVGSIEKLEIHEQVPRGWQIISSNSNYSYNEGKGEIAWMLGLPRTKIKDSTITYVIVPNSKAGKFFGTWISYPDGKKGKIAGKQSITAKINKTPLIINVTYPLNNSNITTKSVYVTATTNRKAICQYAESMSISFDGTGAGGGSRSRQMNITNGTFHSQLIENLQNNGHYTIKLSCIDTLKNFQFASVEFWARTLMPAEYVKLSTSARNLWIGSSINSVKGSLSESDLPSLLSDGKIYLNATKFITYSPTLLLGSSMIENSTSNGDLDSPKVLIEIGTNSSNYLYKYGLSFSNNVNFSAIHGKVIKMVGEDYTIGNDSTNQKIVLIFKEGYEYLTLEKNKPANRNGFSINGTYVKFNDFPSIINLDTIGIIDIIFAMQDSKKDYIAVGESYDDTLFQNIRIAFESYSETGGAKIYIGSIKGKK